MTNAVWTPRQAEFDAFATLSGDANPIHLDPDHAARTDFGRPVCHGMLIYARLWAMVGKTAAQHRVVSIMFPNPAYADEPLELTVSHSADGIDLRAERKADGAPVLVASVQAA